MLTYSPTSLDTRAGPVPGTSLLTFAKCGEVRSSQSNGAGKARTQAAPLQARHTGTWKQLRHECHPGFALQGLLETMTSWTDSWLPDTVTTLVVVINVQLTSVRDQ